MLQGPGENAGVIDVGDGLAVALKVESHNHPSAVEPFQGAATGVGGILRDIFAMGARPIAILDSLRFGELDAERQRHLFARVVEGVGHYGNCVGVANVGGEVEFEPAYAPQLPGQRDVRGRAAGRAAAVRRRSRFGQPGRAVRRPHRPRRHRRRQRARLAGIRRGLRRASGRSVQIGDPFTGKKLIECTLALLDAGLVVSLQDLGAAGLASSTSEMASSGGVGPRRRPQPGAAARAGMEPFEIMISESQERMAAIVEPPSAGRRSRRCARTGRSTPP